MSDDMMYPLFIIDNLSFIITNAYFAEGEASGLKIVHDASK